MKPKGKGRGGGRGTLATSCYPLPAGDTQGPAHPVSFPGENAGCSGLGIWRSWIPTCLDLRGTKEPVAEFPPPTPPHVTLFSALPTEVWGPFPLPALLPSTLTPADKRDRCTGHRSGLRQPLLCCFPALGLGQVTDVRLSFLICQMGVVIAPSSRGCLG